MLHDKQMITLYLQCTILKKFLLGFSVHMYTTNTVSTTFNNFGVLSTWICSPYVYSGHDKQMIPSYI